MDPFLGEIRLFAFGKTPDGWLPCNGQTLQMAQYAGLASLLGNQYGGDGRTTFMLPDLRGRVPLHRGTRAASGAVYQQGKAGGLETVTLTSTQMPQHTHALSAFSAVATTTNPTNAFPATLAGVNTPLAVPSMFGPPPATVAIAPVSIGSVGGGAGHENRQPYLAMNFCIAISGIWPLRP